MKFAIRSIIATLAGATLSGESKFKQCNLEMPQLHEDFDPTKVVGGTLFTLNPDGSMQAAMAYYQVQPGNEYALKNEDGETIGNSFKANDYFPFAG